MAGRRNRSRRRRHLRAKVEEVDTAAKTFHGSSSSPASSSSPDDRTTQWKIPPPNRRQQQEPVKEPEPEEEAEVEESPAPRRGARDARSRRQLLLSIIRGYYLDAISRLPAAELRTTLARGFFVAGHCYGPFRPVENIIINSVWYSAAFPFCVADSDAIDVAVITTEGIGRLAHRSLDGLVTSLCQLCPVLSHDDALWHLCLSGADLHAAAASARGAAPFAPTELEAVPFQVAAQAARHPKPAALALFVTSVLPAVKRDALSLLAGKRSLSSHDIQRLSAMLLPSPLPDDMPPHPSPRQGSPRIIRIIDERRKCLKTWYQTLLDVADAALRKYARQTGMHYHLHTIYGQSMVDNEDDELDRYFHINFMAWPEADPSSSVSQSQAPVRFFAEAHDPPLTDCLEEDITLCCMLPQPTAYHVDNCYACLISDQKVDHPDAEEYFGGHPHETGETEKDRDSPSTVDVDCRFFDPDRDIDFVEYYADHIARVEAICAKPRSVDDSVKDAGALCSKYSLEEDDSDDEDNLEDNVSDEDLSKFCRRYV